MLIKLNLHNWIGYNYSEFVFFDAKYKIFETAKNSKKSTVFARMLVLRLLVDRRACAMVLRKYMKEHAKSTFEDIKSAFKALNNFCGYRYENEWKYSFSNRGLYFENFKTGQKILFESFDNYDSVTGASLGADDSDNKLYWSIIWLEEPIQKNDENDTQITDDELISNFLAIESTLFRGRLPQYGKREVWMSYNDWKPNSKFKEYFVNKYVTKNEPNLIKHGKQFLYDPEAFGNAGGLWVFAGSGINEFMDDETRQTYKQWKVSYPELFKVMVLGCGAQFEGSAYGENLKLVSKISKIEKGYLFFGIDYSSSIDETVITAVIISEDYWKIQIVDKWSYNHRQASLTEKLNDTQQVEKLWDFIEKTCIKFKSSMVNKKVYVYLDSKDTVVRSYLNDKRNNSRYKDLIHEIMPAAKFGIAGKKVRVAAVRMLMSLKRISIMPNIYNFYVNEWSGRVFKANGDIKDGNDDASQSFEYAISNIFQFIFTPQDLKILKAIKENV